MPSLTWTAEGGIGGVAITTGNSGGASGDAWDISVTGANATNRFTATALVGRVGMELSTGASSVQSRNGWSTKVAARWPAGMTTEYGRAYIQIPALPAADRTFVELLDLTAAVNRGNIRVRSVGTVRIRNAANGTVATTTTVLSLDTRYRVEWRIDGSVTGAWELKLFLGDSTSALESLSGTDNFGGTIGAFQFGHVANVANTPAIFMDGITINDTGLPGPAVYNSVTRGHWEGTWAAGGNLPAHRVADDFADNSVNTQLWTQFAFGSVTGSETGGTYQFAVTTAGTGGASLFTQSKYDISGDYFAAELAGAGVQEAGLQTYPCEFQIDGNNRVFVVVAGGFIGCYAVVAGVFTEYAGFPAYDAAIHRWFRVREAAGTTFWEVSSSGVTWTTLASVANPIATTAVTLLVATDTFLTLLGAKTITIGQVSAPVLT